MSAAVIPWREQNRPGEYAMKEALKGIEVDLVRLHEQREDKEAEQTRREKALVAEFERAYEAIDAQVAALEEARRALLNVNGSQPITDKELDAALDAQPPRDPQPEHLEQLANRAKKSHQTLAAADRMEAFLRTADQGMTERELGDAAKLKGRGSAGVREAALRLLVDEHKVIVANQTSSDGTPLYASANDV